MLWISRLFFHSVPRSLGYPALKLEQLSMLRSFVCGKDVFGVLPTGFGKSLCYACLPAILDGVRGCSRSKVVGPLTEIMTDQVSKRNVAKMDFHGVYIQITLFSNNSIWGTWYLLLFIYSGVNR